MFREPKLIDKIKGCVDWFIFGIECFIKGESLLFAKDMFLGTIRGNFKVKKREGEDENKDEQRLEK